MKKRVILAYSGGLDTSFCIAWLKERGYQVITVFVDTGSFSRSALQSLSAKAYELGAAKHYTVNAKKQIYEKIIAYLIKSNGLYQDIYPQLCADRYIIVEKCCEIAQKEKTHLIAHGCTAMGNDQSRFDISIKALGNYEIIAPIREIQKSVQKNIRQYEIDYLKKRGFAVPLSHKKYSINQNILGTTISGSEIDLNEEPPESVFVLTKKEASCHARYLTIEFRQGLPVSLDGKPMPNIALLQALNNTVGSHGFGRFIYTGDCIIGIKGRIAFECPGLYALIVAHKALEDATLSREQNQFKSIISHKWASLIYSGLYFDPLRQNLEKFIDAHQQFVTGSVTLKLHDASLLPVTYSSPYLIREKNTVYAQSSAWLPQEAEGFIKLSGLSTILAQRSISTTNRGKGCKG